MSTVIFLGSQEDVAQVGTVTVTAWDVTTTYILTAGDTTKNLSVAISVLGDTDTTVTAAALVTAWNASTHPYCKYITATSSAAVITLTAQTDGVPFTVVSSKSGGAGTIGAYTAVTANQSGSDIDDAANYDGGAKPTSSDTLVHALGAPAMAWGLEAYTALTAVVFKHLRGAGNVGLDRMAFAISSDGQTKDPNAREYRPHYLKSAFATVEIGQSAGPTLAASATRIKIDNTTAGACATDIFSVDGTSIDAGLPTVRLLLTDGAADIDIVSAAGGVGVAVDAIGETSQVGTVTVHDKTGATNFVTSAGVDIVTAYQQNSGTAILRASGAVQTIVVRGGTVEVFGSFAIGTVGVENEGVFRWSSSGTITNIASNNGGTVDGTRNEASKTCVTLTPRAGFTLIGNPGMTFTNSFEPAGVLYSILFK